MSFENDLFDLDNNSNNSSINEDDKNILYGFEKIINSEKIHSVIPENQSIRTRKSRKSVSQSSKKTNVSRKSFLEEPQIEKKVEENNFYNTKSDNGNPFETEQPFDPVKPASVKSSPRPINVEKEKMELLTEYEYEVKKNKNRNTLPVLSKHSHIEDIQYELNRIKLQRKRQNSIDFYQSCTVSFAKGIEMVFDKFDLFDIDMNGFSVSIKHSSEKFEDIYSELYEKYKGTGQNVPPELRFIGVFLTCAIDLL
jgi:hypothetical protein